MNGSELLSQRQAALVTIIRDAFGTNRQSDGFALRLLEGIVPNVIPSVKEFVFRDISPEYGGYPEIAYLGFSIGATHSVSSVDIQSFLSSLHRLHDRQGTLLDAFKSDDIALLGIADGFSKLRAQEIDTGVLSQWLISIIDTVPSIRTWSFRARLLSGELIEPRGRLQTLPNTSNHDEIALEIALRNVWPDCFHGHKNFDTDIQSKLLKTILASAPPSEGDLDRAVVWLKALDVLVDNTCQALTPSISDTSRILTSIQGAMKRWVWKDRSSRRGAQASQWLIDEETDVQALLWAILFPLYGSELVDERYLRDCGFVQAKADLGILKLKLIIEVKMVRYPRDFKELEGQIGEDLGLYFWDEGQFDRMIVFVYDDSDHPQPEKYDVFRNALLRRGNGRIEDVIIVRRPSMIPDRNRRLTQSLQNRLNSRRKKA